MSIGTCICIYLCNILIFHTNRSGRNFMKFGYSANNWFFSTISNRLLFILLFPRTRVLGIFISVVKRPKNCSDRLAHYLFAEWDYSTQDLWCKQSSAITQVVVTTTHCYTKPLYLSKALRICREKSFVFLTMYPGQITISNFRKCFPHEGTI